MKEREEGMGGGEEGGVLRPRRFKNQGKKGLLCDGQKNLIHRNF